MNQILEAYGNFFGEVTAAGVMAGGDPVEASSSAVTVREREGSTQTTPGPYSPGGEIRRHRGAPDPEAGLSGRPPEGRWGQPTALPCAGGLR
jgi:hypothetical protein